MRFFRSDMMKNVLPVRSREWTREQEWKKLRAQIAFVLEEVGNRERENRKLKREIESMRAELCSLQDRLTVLETDLGDRK